MLILDLKVVHFQFSQFDTKNLQERKETRNLARCNVFGPRFVMITRLDRTFSVSLSLFHSLFPSSPANSPSSKSGHHVLALDCNVFGPEV